MGKSIKKPIRIDYYPKTEEHIDEFEKIQIENSLDRKLNCKMGVQHMNFEKPVKENEVIKCSESIVEDVEVIEKPIDETVIENEET